MKYLADIKNLKDVKVLLRLDLNVPIKNGTIVDDFRIRKALPTLAYLQEHGAKTIIVAHIESVGNTTLKPVAEYLARTLPVTFVSKLRNAYALSEKLERGQFLLVENLRVNEGEESNSKDFAKELASLADIYVNDAFSVSHRKHASICRITEFLPSYAGMLFQNEIEHLQRAFTPTKPFLFILAGAKFDTKLPLIEKFMNIADYVFVGGALANNFYKEKGLEIGTSLVSPEKFNLDRYFNNPKLLLPIDVIVRNAGKTLVRDIGSVAKDDCILDAGPKTVALLEEKIDRSSFILWNGPLGSYEQGFTEPTIELATKIADSTAESVVGGGDTLATIASLNNEDKYTFVSGGGGAMLDYLANETLPGIIALDESK